jgi:hypothetical protein
MASDLWTIDEASLAAITRALGSPPADPEAPIPSEAA